jgi:hypothetical protein
MAELGPENEIEARLVRRMAVAFWKGERAERIEVALFDAAPRLCPPVVGGTWEDTDPLTTFDLKRFNAVRGYQAQRGRELSGCPRELRRLRREPMTVDAEHEPETELRNEPCLSRARQEGGAPAPGRGWARGAGDRGGPRGEPAARRGPAPPSPEPGRSSGASPRARRGRGMGQRIVGLLGLGKARLDARGVARRGEARRPSRRGRSWARPWPAAASRLVDGTTARGRKMLVTLDAMLRAKQAWSDAREA